MVQGYILGSSIIRILEENLPLEMLHLCYIYCMSILYIDFIFKNEQNFLETQYMLIITDFLVHYL